MRLKCDCFKIRRASRAAPSHTRQTAQTPRHVLCLLGRAVRGAPVLYGGSNADALGLDEWGVQGYQRQGATRAARSRHGTESPSGDHDT